MGFPACPTCASPRASLFFESTLGWSVRSDWVPTPASARILVCGDCHALFKPRELVAKWSDYRDYHVWGNSPERDKVDFSAAPVTRSSAILSFLKDSGVLGDGSAILDYGCNRGAFLALLGQGPHAGFDVSEHYRPIVEGLGFRYYTPESPPPAADFDVLTLIHVAEHLDIMRDALGAGLRALRPGGTVMIQVPDPFEQPTDLYVIDHCSHFTPDTLDRAVGSAGLANAGGHHFILKGEMSAAYRRGPGTGPSAPVTSLEELGSIRESLVAGERALTAFRNSGMSCAVFGAGLLGSMVARFLEGRVRCFIDDNIALHGRVWMDVPIQSLESLKDKDLALVVAVPPSASRAVERKCRAAGRTVVTPFFSASRPRR